MSEYWHADAQCRVVSRLATFFVGYPNRNQISNLATIDATTYVCSVPMKSQTVDETGDYPYLPMDEGFDLYCMRFLDSKTHLPTSIQGQPLMSGGVPALYDGQHVSEYGFHYGPLLGLAAEALEQGELTHDTLYQWIAIYTWLDSRGVRHQSWLSNIVQFTTTSSVEVGHAVYFDVWDLTLTEHEDADDESQPVMIEIYRAGGTSDGLFHLEQVLENDRSQPYQTVWSILPDVDIEEKEILYTEGGVLQDTTCPACKHIVANADRVWLISADDPEFLWHTKINGRDSILPGFNTDFIQRTQIGAGATALASLDDKLIVFKEHKIFAYVGDPPNNQGLGGSLNGPNLLSVATGCIDPRSVCNCPAGVVFQATDGIYVLSRGLEVQKIGSPVEDTLATYPIVTSAVHVEALELVLFTATTTAGTYGVTLAWHYQINEWTIWHTQDSLSAAKAPAISAAMCMRESVPLYHQAQPTELVLYVDPVVYADHDGTARAYTVTTPWLQFAGVQGFQRVRRITLLGTYRPAHTLTFKIYYDFNSATYDTYSLTAAQVTALVLGSSREQVSIHVPQQKCEAIRVEVTATQYGVGTGKLVRWESILIEVGGKPGTFRLPVAARV